MKIDREKLIEEGAKAAFLILQELEPESWPGTWENKSDGTRNMFRAEAMAVISVIEPILVASEKMHGALLTYSCSYSPHHGQIVRDAVDKAITAYEQATGKETP